MPERFRCGADRGGVVESIGVQTESGGRHRRRPHVPLAERSVLLYPEDSIDWSAIPGSEWYRPEQVPKAIAGIRNADPTAPDILFAVANSHAGELYPAAVSATPILIDIATQSSNKKAVRQALVALDELVWFRGAPPHDTVVFNNTILPLERAICELIEAARPQLTALVNRDRSLSKIVRRVWKSIEEQNA